MKIHTVLVVSTFLIASCGGGGNSGSSSCSTIGPNVNFAVISGGVDNLQAAADRNLGSFATLNSGASGSYVTSKGVSFSGGTNAGVFITPPTGMTASDITVSTFQTQEQATVESATGPTLTITPTPNDPATKYVSFKTTAPFNGVKLQVNTASAVQYLVFEICGDAAVH